MITNGNEKQLSIISAVGYVEVLCLALNQTDDVRSDFPLIRKIYEQRFGFENLTLFMRDFKLSGGIKEIHISSDHYKLLKTQVIEIRKKYSSPLTSNK